MINKYVRQYLIALGAVFTAMLGYHVTVVPMLEPTSRAAQNLPLYGGIDSEERWWQRHFPEQSWQNDSPKVLQTPRGILLFKTWKQLGPDQWKLQPLTMIIPQRQSGREEVPSDIAGSEDLTDQDVWLINAEKGATIQFREALDWTKRRMPPVIGGRLEGQINITRRAKDGDVERPWVLTTRDLNIDRRRIWTVEPVEIRWDSSVVRGRDLSVMLKHDLLGKASDDASPWGVLESMELIYIDEINVGLPPGGLWADVKPTAPELPITRGLPARLKVESGGPFRFDFLSSQATLMNRVHVTHEVGTLPPDQFWSQELQVNLEPEPSHAAPVNAANSKSIDMGGLQLKRLLARGMDPVGPINGQTLVQVDAPNIAVKVRGKRLDVNFSESQIELSGRLEGPQATETVTALSYLGYEFRSPQIQYRQAPGGEHLGWLVAAGPGELLVPAGSEYGKANVRWQQSLHMKPDQQDQWISLSGKTLLESQRYGFLLSDALDIWLKPNPAASQAASVSTTTTPAYLPDRLRASGSVQIATPQLKSMVNELKLWLVHAPTATEKAEPTQALPLADSAGNPMYQFVSPPAAPSDSSGVKPAGPVAATPQSEPVTVEGHEIQARVVIQGKESLVDFLTVAGPLKIYQQPPTAPTPQWTVTGQQLSLSTNTDRQADISVVGHPAKVSMGEAWLTTAEVRYNQQTGLLWMDQPGEFSISAAAMQASQHSSLQGGSSLTWLDSPRCKWSGHLHFDGSVARLQGDIELTGTVSTEQNRIWWLNGRCQRMDLQLLKPIDMRAPKATTTSLERVILENAVDLRAAQTDAEFNRLSLERIVAPELTFHVPQNQIVVSGPGDVRSWLKGKPQNSGIVPQQATAAPVERIHGIHLNFRNSMVVYTDRSEVICEGKVEMAAGLLNSFDDVIDLNSMQRLKNDEMLLGCDQLNAYDTSKIQPRPGSLIASPSRSPGVDTGDGFWEFRALGNVRFNGKSAAGDYSGYGYRVTYTQAKDLLVLEGDGRIPAHVRVLPADGQQQSAIEADVNSGAINVKTMATRDLRVTQISAGSATSGSPEPVRPGPLGVPANRAPVENDNTNPRQRMSDWYRK